MKRLIFIILIFFSLLCNIGYAASNHYLKLTYQFSGVQDPEIQKNIQNTLKNQYTKLHFPLTQAEINHFLLKAPPAIQNAITPYGYFHSKIAHDVTKNANEEHVNFYIQPGPPVLISHVIISIEGAGKNDPKFQAWVQSTSLKVGKPLHTPDYDDAKSDLYDLATHRGYFSAKLIKNQIQINLDTNQATIILIFDTGPRVRIGDTTFSKTTLKESFLKRYLTYKQGQWYNAKYLEKTQEGLVNSTFFNQVIVKPEPDKIQNGVVPIYIKLIPRLRKQYTFGLGYGTDTGIRGTAGITLRHLNGEGHRFQTLVRASQSNSSAVAKYLIPGFRPANDLFTIAAGITNMNQTTGTANNKKFGVEYSTQQGKWKHSLELAYLNENYNITTLPSTSTELVYPTWTSKYINTDHPRNPTQGLSLAFLVTGAEQAILSETSFYQMQIHLKTLYTIEPTRTRLIFRSDAGRTEISNLDNLPLSLQLFAGGADSVRGFSYNGIGPGRNLLVLSSEVQERVYKNFYLAGFIDAGNVTDGNVFQQMDVGTGPGIVWLSPIGSLELTLANAISVPGNPWRVQFTMGTTL